MFKYILQILPSRSIPNNFSIFLCVLVSSKLRRGQSDLTLTIQRLALQVLCNFFFPLVSIRQQLFLIVQKLLVTVRRVFKVWSFHNRVYRTRLLAKTAVYALGHIDVVLCRSSRSIFSFFRIYGNRLRRTDGFAQFTRDTSLLPGWVSSQRVFPAKPRRERTFFERVIYRHLGIKKVFQR